MSKDEWSIYHNPRCSKSRSALALLQARGIEPRVIEYLKTPPDEAALRALLSKLGMPADQLLRKGEEIYKENFAEKTLSEAQALAALARYPVLLERPIVVRGERAVLGRPPENVAQLLDEE